MHTSQRWARGVQAAGLAGSPLSGVRYVRDPEKPFRTSTVQGNFFSEKFFPLEFSFERLILTMSFFNESVPNGAFPCGNGRGGGSTVYCGVGIDGGGSTVGDITCRLRRR